MEIRALRLDVTPGRLAIRSEPGCDPARIADIFIIPSGVNFGRRRIGFLHTTDIDHDTCEAVDWHQLGTPARVDVQ